MSTETGEKTKEPMVQLFEAIRENKYRLDETMKKKFEDQISKKFLKNLSELSYHNMVLYVNDFLRQVWLKGAKND